MNGFLDALLARTDGRLPVLERRVRSLFEPVPGAPAASLGERGADVPARAADGEAQTSNAAQALAARFAPRPPAERANAPHEVPTARHSVSPPPEVAAPIVARLAWLPRDDRALAIRPVATVAHDVHHNGAKAVTAHHDAAPAPRQQRVDAPIAHSPSARAARRTEAVAPSPSGLPMQRPAAPASATAVRLAAAQTAAAARRDAPAAPASAPVQISIGRIEIRAMQAAADKPRAVGPAPPRLSLDAYLQRRNGTPR